MAAGITLYAVVFRDDALWVAQVIEYDIGAQAADLDTLNRRLSAVLKAELAESIARFGDVGLDPPRFVASK